MDVPYGRVWSQKKLKPFIQIFRILNLLVDFKFNIKICNGGLKNTPLKILKSSGKNLNLGKNTLIDFEAFGFK